MGLMEKRTIGVNIEADSLDEVRDQQEPRTLVVAAYRRLRRDIVQGRYKPGQKLRVEHLKLTYGVSAGTLREALALLISDSLVVSSEQRGFRVAPMSLEDIVDLTRTRVLLECEALRESIEVGDDDWEASIVACYHKLSLAEDRLRTDAAGTFDEWEGRNREFHDALVAGCSSRWIRQLRTTLYQQSERYRRLSATEGPPPVSVHDEHREIFEAALARDTERALTALKSHINRSLSVIQSSGLIR